MSAKGELAKVIKNLDGLIREQKAKGMKVSPLINQRKDLGKLYKSITGRSPSPMSGKRKTAVGNKSCTGVECYIMGGKTRRNRNSRRNRRTRKH